MVPYLSMLILVGLPIFFLEFVLGQYSGCGPTRLFGNFFFMKCMNMVQFPEFLFLVPIVIIFFQVKLLPCSRDLDLP